MKKALMTTAVLLGFAGLAHAAPNDGVNAYDNVKIKEQRIVDQQVTTTDADGNAVTTTTSQSQDKTTGINALPGASVNGEPAFEIKQEVSTSEPVSTTTGSEVDAASAVIAE